MTGAKVSWPGFFAAGALMLAFAAGGCGGSRTLVAAPNLHLGAGGAAALERTPAPRRSPEVQVLYVTDRAIEGEEPFGPRYGYKRSMTVDYGTATVAIEPAQSWEELAAASVTRQRPHKFTLRTTAVQPLGRMAAVSTRMVIENNRFTVPPSQSEAMLEEDRLLQELLRDALEQSSAKDVYISVHGYNNTFDDSVHRTAEVWHYMGRPGVAIAYTWPAGYPGLFGYVYDRESGEFTIYNLKRLLRAVAACAEVERVHLVAHSRGTDVVITALRELNIESHARREDTQQRLKLQTLVLAAPDIDWDVFRQRFEAEQLANAANQTVIYFSNADEALSWAQWMFGSLRRLGNMLVKDFGLDQRKVMTEFPRVEFINCQVTGPFGTTHNYVFAHPAVLSDLILVLRDSRRAGAAHGRPLTPPVEGLWEIRNDYLLDKPAPSGDVHHHAVSSP